MSTTKSNMAGAWMNKKKENEKLKSQLVVLESNQNGVRLIMNETGFYVNVTINSNNNFRWPILVSEPVITTNIIEDNEETLLMAEIEKEWKAMEAKMRKDKIVSLRAEAIRKRAEAEILINDGKRERQIVKRKDLSEVITRRTQFKTTIKGQVKTATTEDGCKINGDGVEYDTLNKWLDTSVRSITGDNKTKKSVFEVVFYYNNTINEWRKLGDDYTAETTKLN